MKANRLKNGKAGCPAEAVAIRPSSVSVTARVACLTALVLVFAGVATARERSESRSRHGGRVVLFEHPRFQGESIVLGAGDTLSDLSDVRFPDGRGANDAVSSILIEGGVEVTVGGDARFRGETRRFVRSVANLHNVRRPSGGDWNDVISSVRVERERGGRGAPDERWTDRDRNPRTDRARVIVYRDSNFRGESFEIRPGEIYDDLSRDEFEGWNHSNDEISSIRVIGPVRVRIGSDSNFRGDVHEFTSDFANLRVVRRGHRGDDWNDDISSIMVEYLDDERGQDRARERSDR